MSEVPDGKCGYTWPEAQEVGDFPYHQNCCYRDTVEETGRCAWHADPEETDAKTVEELKEVRVAPESRAQTQPAGELLDGATLTGLELEDAISLTRISLRGADLKDADLWKADLTDADLWKADLSDADLLGTGLTHANLHRADLSDAFLRYTNLTDANVKQATLKESDLRGATCPGLQAHQADFQGADLRDAEFGQSDTAAANLEDAILKETDMRGTDFQRTRLYQTDLTQARINAETTFTDQGTTVYEDDPDLDGWFDNTTDTAYQAGAWVHRRLERLHENNALSKRAREYHIRKQEAERGHHWQRRYETKPRKSLLHTGRYVAMTANKWLTNHGESLQRILAWAVGVVLLSALLYPLVGGVGSNMGGEQVIHELDPEMSAGEIGSVYARSLYFSVITFSTIGYGIHFPAGTGSRILVGLESLAGAVLVALFIFVLGRRTAR